MLREVCGSGVQVDVPDSMQLFKCQDPRAVEKLGINRLVLMYKGKPLGDAELVRDTERST